MVILYTPYTHRVCLGVCRYEVRNSNTIYANLGTVRYIEMRELPKVPKPHCQGQKPWVIITVHVRSDSSEQQSIVLGSDDATAKVLR